MARSLIGESFGDGLLLLGKRVHNDGTACQICRAAIPADVRCLDVCMYLCTYIHHIRMAPLGFQEKAPHAC